MLTDDEVESGLGLLELPWVDRILVKYAGGEGCHWQYMGDNEAAQGRELLIGPGEPADFEPDARIGGQSGTSVTDTAGAEEWFSTDDGGTLAIGRKTDLGYLFVRIGITQPQADDAVRLSAVMELAAEALPRFPGMSATDSEPDVVTSDRQPLDTSNVSYADNLLAREQDGYWSLGLGLVRTLQLFAGEVDEAIVLNDPDIVDPSSADVLALARQYLVDGPDENDRKQIARLLDKLVFTHDELEEMSAGAQPTVLTASLAQPRNDPQLRLDDPCSDIHEAHPCAEQTIAPSSLKSAYQVYLVPNAQALLDAGWSLSELLWVGEALSDSAQKYEQLGSMSKRVDVTVTGFAGQTVVEGSSDDCSLVVNRGMQGMDEARFKQWLTADLAECFIAATLPTQAKGSPTGRSWWRRALALYLSNLVYPAPRCSYGRCDLEWSLAQEFADEEVHNNMVAQRSATNWLFFQQLEKTEEASGILRLITLLPSGTDAAANQLKLASYEGMPGLFHDFAKDVTDNLVADTGGGQIPYLARATEHINLSPDLGRGANPQPFDVVRFELSVPADKYACMAYTFSGSMKTSWRQGELGGDRVAGDWSEDLPAALDGDSVLIVTATEPGAYFTFRVTDVGDSPSCAPTPEPASAAPGCMCGFSDFFRFADAVSEQVQNLIDGR